MFSLQAPAAEQAGRFFQRAAVAKPNWEALGYGIQIMVLFENPILDNGRPRSENDYQNVLAVLKLYADRLNDLGFDGIEVCTIFRNFFKSTSPLGLSYGDLEAFGRQLEFFTSFLDHDDFKVIVQEEFFAQNLIALLGGHGHELDKLLPKLAEFIKDEGTQEGVGAYEKLGLRKGDEDVQQELLDGQVNLLETLERLTAEFRLEMAASTSSEEEVAAPARAEVAPARAEVEMTVAASPEVEKTVPAKSKKSKSNKKSKNPKKPKMKRTCKRVRFTGPLPQHQLLLDCYKLENQEEEKFQEHSSSDDEILSFAEDEL